MKKTYEKPQVYMERFELAEHIAGCSITMNMAVEGGCSGDGTINDVYSGAWFLMDNTACSSKAEAYCYTQGSGSIVTINS